MFDWILQSLVAGVNALLLQLQAMVVWLWQQLMHGVDFLLELMAQVALWLYGMLPSGLQAMMAQLAPKLAQVYQMIKVLDWLVPVIAMTGMWIGTMAIVLTIRLVRTAKSFLPSPIPGAGAG